MHVVVAVLCTTIIGLLNLAALQKRLEGREFFFLSTKAGKSYVEAEFRPGSVLVFGSETRGLADDLLREQMARAASGRSAASGKSSR